MPFYTGDYYRDTRHLSMLQHGAYRLLLDHCWDQRGPLPLDPERCYRITGAVSKEEQDAVRSVIAEFFVAMPDGHYNRRIQQEIERAAAISGARAKAGRKGGLAKAKQLPSKSLASASTPTTTTTTTTTATTTDTLPGVVGGVSDDTPLVPDAARRRRQAVPDCPYDDLIAAFHDHCPTLPRVEVVNEVRRARLRARWREVAAEHLDDADPRAATLDWFTFFFRDRVDASPFLTGKVKDWHATFDWLLNPTNFAKVVEGQYLRDKEAAR